jgi:hypothetical protein
LTNGLFTCDNKRFVRHFTEVDENERHSYVPYDKGGGRKWFSTTPYLLEWQDNGNRIREFRFQRGQSRALPGERFYFQQGITYSYIGTKGFKARLLSPGSIFDIASSAIFSHRFDQDYLLGFFNSALVRYILGMLNPTVNFQIGDLRRIPMIDPSKKTERLVAELTQNAIKVAVEADIHNPVSPAYTGPMLNNFLPASGGVNDHQIQIAYERLVRHIEDMNKFEKGLQTSIDELIFDQYRISDTTRSIILENEWVTSTDENLIEIPTLERCLKELAAFNDK